MLQNFCFCFYWKINSGWSKVKIGLHGVGTGDICRLKSFQIVEHLKVNGIGFYETANVLDKVLRCCPVKKQCIGPPFWRLDVTTKFIMWCWSRASYFGGLTFFPLPKNAVQARFHGDSCSHMRHDTLWLDNMQMQRQEFLPRFSPNHDAAISVKHEICEDNPLPVSLPTVVSRQCVQGYPQMIRTRMHHRAFLWWSQDSKDWDVAEARGRVLMKSFLVTLWDLPMIQATGRI